jgi:thiol-disulfide isomerase/thioredoxin
MRTLRVLSMVLWAGIVGSHTGCQPPGSDGPTFSQLANPGDLAVTQPPVASPPAAAAASQAAEAPQIEVKLADVAQLEETVRAQAGKIVVVDVWSLSCAPCLREFPNLVELSHKYPEQVSCISLNVDYIGLKSKPPESYRPAVEDFLKKQKAQLINLLSATSDEAILTKFKLEAIPAILIYGTDGRLLHTLTDVNTGDDGLTYAGDVIPKIEQLLAQLK